VQLSYWEYKSWLSNIDFTVVGSGIVGLNCALRLKLQNPKAKVLVLEKGILPQGASTKNAGFACFGSISEVKADLKHHKEDEVVDLVQKRWNGIQFLRENLGDQNIDFQQHGGHELFLNKDRKLYEECLTDLEHVNQLLLPVYGDKAFSKSENIFRFRKIHENYITNVFEGQIDTGKMMHNLLKLVQKNNITILNNISVEAFSENNDSVKLKTNQFDFITKKLFLATNGFASQLLKVDLKPARTQILITKPIHNLQIKGTFHFDEGYYYFRNIDRRVLFGGGRNLDFKGEETINLGTTELIQEELKRILKDTVLPNTTFEVERSWSGIMGVGKQKNPIVKSLSNHVYCGVRMGGMGIAIGSLIGKELADLA